jgi:hypothetical protein
MQIIIRSSIHIVFFLIIFQSIVFAQGLTEPLTKGYYELGYSHYWYKGDFYWNPANPSFDDTWSNGTIYFRLGLYDVISISLETMVWPVNSSKNYPGESFLNYTLGIGLSSQLINLFIFEIFIDIHYLENMYLDRSDQKSDKRFRDLLVGTPIRFQFLKSYTIWLAPVYVWNESEYFEDQTYTRSSNSLGVSIGVDALLFKHLYLNFNTIYAEYFKPRLTVGYRF